MAGGDVHQRDVDVFTAEDEGSPPHGGGDVTIVLHYAENTVAWVPGQTILECARRAGLAPPFSCEEGNCGTCMAKLSKGSATMAVNDALMPDEVAEGYTLTCQAVPDGPGVVVNYDE